MAKDLRRETSFSSTTLAIFSTSCTFSLPSVENQYYERRLVGLLICVRMSVWPLLVTKAQHVCPGPLCGTYLLLRYALVGGNALLF